MPSKLSALKAYCRGYLFSLLGGWPGALLSVYWITVVVNLIVLGLIVFEVIDVQAIMIEI
ncbi:hypothetical protein [Alteromonas gracilis]|uniref:hypothetical protein n=1 Tax=Alteromonas gracilis TaxID=1479524 RepID=UPI002FDFD385